MLGDRMQLTPVVKHQAVSALSMKQSMFTRLLRLRLPSLPLTR